MRVTLATSPHVRHVGVLQNDFRPGAALMYTFAPVGLLSLMSVTREQLPEIFTTLYDTNRRMRTGQIPLSARFYASIAQDVLAGNPDVVGFMTECDSYHHVLQFADELKRQAPDVKVVLGGPHASAVARATMERVGSVDAIVVGEGERSFPDLLTAVAGRDARPVPGTLRRSEEDHGAISDGGPAPLVASLDDLPMPAYDAYTADPGEEVFIEVGRGCPFQCTFCSTAPYWSRRHRVKSPARIVAEVRHVQGLFGTKRAHFTHDLFTTDRRWVRAVCEELIAADAPIQWTCSARTDTVDGELLGLMAQAGCNAIYFGIESGSQRVLKEIHKDIPLEHSFRVLEECKAAGITPNAGFIVGLPADDDVSLRETFDAYEKALRVGTRPTHIFGYCPFAGSSLYPSLTDLECSGHFVDIPLGARVDRANRRRIAGDPDLYGAYFRPRLAGASDETAAEVSAMDEFSPLVEAALFPTLALSELVGGMHVVFERWFEWVRAVNRERHAESYRSGYGSPSEYARFLVATLHQAQPLRPAAADAAEALQLHLTLAEAAPATASTTMATHRSLPRPSFDDPDSIGLGTTLVGRRIVGLMRSEFDVSRSLQGDANEPPSARTNLVWQVGDDGDTRLLRVSDAVYDLFSAIAYGAASVGELILSRVNTQPSDEDAPFDAPSTLAAARVAARDGLIQA